MPSVERYGDKYIRRGWELMARWERKEFHRENESRVRNGMKPLPKPTTIHQTGGV